MMMLIAFVTVNQLIKASILLLLLLMDGIHKERDVGISNSGVNCLLLHKLN